MKLDLDREKGLELFGKLIRTKNVESLQGDQPKTGPEPLHPTDSKQKLQVKTNNGNDMMSLKFNPFFSPYICDAVANARRTTRKTGESRVCV